MFADQINIRVESIILKIVIKELIFARFDCRVDEDDEISESRPTGFLSAVESVDSAFCCPHHSITSNFMLYDIRDIARELALDSREDEGATEAMPDGDHRQVVVAFPYLFEFEEDLLARRAPDVLGDVFPSPECRNVPGAIGERFTTPAQIQSYDLAIAACTGLFEPIQHSAEAAEVIIAGASFVMPAVGEDDEEPSFLSLLLNPVHDHLFLRRIDRSFVADLDHP